MAARLQRRVVAWLAALGVCLALPALAEKFEDQPEAPDFVTVAVTPQYQRLTRLGERHGNYELDFIGLISLRRGAGAIGDTRLGWWWLRNDTFAGRSTGELSEAAGLLWDFNDGDAPEASNALGVLALQQSLLDERLTLKIGKLYPGNDFAESDYTGDDRATFMSALLAGEIAGRWFDTIGLGLHVAWEGSGWFLQGTVVDAQAESSGLDFDSLGKGKFLWSAEFGYQPERRDGLTRVALMPYAVDGTDALSSETGLVLSLTHEFGADARYAVFGRYTWRDGGHARSPDFAEFELPAERSGFLGLAVNALFGRADQQFAVALMAASPTAARKAAGFNTQYGVEAYWQFAPFDWFLVTPDLQILRNRDDDLETIIGLRFKLFALWPGA